jgi:pilus assembly protein CpaC
MEYRHLIYALTLAAGMSGICSPVLAADQVAPVVEVAASETSSRFIPLGVNKSVVIDLPGDIKDVLVGNPKVANAIVRTPRRVYIIAGEKPGQTTVFFFGADGRQMAGFDIAVTRDLNGVRAALRQSLPDSNIRIEGVGDQAVMLTGIAANPVEAQQAYDIAAKLVGDDKKVVNGITVRGRDQIMLKVKVAEVQRDVIKQLGVDLSGTAGFGSAVVRFNTDNPFTASGQPLANSFLNGSVNNVNATLRAMERAGVIRTLAEPNLTAISGETANFMAGGEFPIPQNFTCDTTKVPPQCQTQVSYKKFGVALAFTPVVLSEGRISLKVATEVSDLSPDNALILNQGPGNTITIPSIRTRKAETVVEIPSGGSLAMAGMIQDQTKQRILGIPGLMQVPVLGTLFRSREYINNQTELMVLVTPYVVRAVAQKQLSSPTDGFVDPTEGSGVLLGRFNRLYGAATPAGSYHGKVGFIVD